MNEILADFFIILGIFSIMILLCHALINVQSLFIRRENFFPFPSFRRFSYDDDADIGLGDDVFI